MSAPLLRPHPDGQQRPYAASAQFAGTVYACGQVPVRADGTVPSDIGEQVGVALDNLDQVLRQAGASLATLLKVTVYLADLADFDAYNDAYLARLASHPLPPRTTVQVAAFRGQKRLEIDAVAASANS